MADLENTYQDEGFPLWLRGSVKYNGEKYVSTKKKHQTRVFIHESTCKTYTPNEKKRTKKRKDTDPIMSRRGWGEYYL